MAQLSVFRQEDKYLLTPAQALACRARIASLLPADPHNGTKGYTVCSLYFDTFAAHDLYAQQNGEYLRRKLRLRIYDNDPSVIKLECKAKRGTAQHKTSLLVTKAQAQELCRGNWNTLSAQDPETAFFHSFFLMGYRPYTLIRYRRHAYTGPSDHVRITFDSHIESCATSSNLFDENLFWKPVCSTGEVVLEVKYDNNLPLCIKEALSPWISQRISYSKYGNSCLKNNYREIEYL